MAVCRKSPHWGAGDGLWIAVKTLNYALILFLSACRELTAVISVPSGVSIKQRSGFVYSLRHEGRESWWSVLTVGLPVSQAHNMEHFHTFLQAFELFTLAHIKLVGVMSAKDQRWSQSGSNQNLSQQRLAF